VVAVVPQGALAGLPPDALQGLGGCRAAQVAERREASVGAGPDAGAGEGLALPGGHVLGHLCEALVKVGAVRAFERELARLDAGDEGFEVEGAGAQAAQPALKAGGEGVQGQRGAGLEAAHPGAPGASGGDPGAVGASQGGPTAAFCGEPSDCAKAEVGGAGEAL
jgi:hypothetical protein